MTDLEKMRKELQRLEIFVERSMIYYGLLQKCNELREEAEGTWELISDRNERRRELQKLIKQHEILL
jgi:hypothetical protein